MKDDASEVSTQFLGATKDLQARISIRDKLTKEYYDECVEKVFRRSWFVIAHEDDVAVPGQYCVVDVPTFKTSVIVVRSQDGTVRGFHNYCRHRGKKIMPTECGRAEGSSDHFTCWLHGWTYGTDGALKVVPDEGSFSELNKSQMGLAPVKVEVWSGLVFAYFGDAPGISLRDWLGELYEGFDGYYSEMERIGTFSTEVRANWHVAMDAFSEGYHTVFLHRNTQPDLAGKKNPMRRYPLIDIYERHMRNSGVANPDYVGPPAERALYALGRKLSPAVETDYSLLPPAVNRTRTSPWFFDALRLFPNYSVLNGANWCSMVWAWPIDHQRTRVITEHYARKARHAGDRLAAAYMRSILTSVTCEDFSAMEEVQEGLESGAFDHIHLSQQELAIQKRYQLTDRMIGS